MPPVEPPVVDPCTSVKITVSTVKSSIDIFKGGNKTISSETIKSYFLSDLVSCPIVKYQLTSDKLGSKNELSFASYADQQIKVDGKTTSGYYKFYI